MSNRKQRLSRNIRKRPEQQEQAQQDYAAFKEWIASGESSKPLTAQELKQMLLVASKIR